MPRTLKFKPAVPVITLNDHRSTMSDWAKRLQRVQSEMHTVETESIDHMSCEDLQDEKVTFGKAHMGKKFSEVWETSQDWVKWFLMHYQESSKVEHKKMIRYIKLKIEEMETQGTGAPQTSNRPKPKPAPKSLAAANRMGPPPHPDAMPEEPGENPEVKTLEDRMTNLENALHQIVVYLTPNTAVNPVPSTMGGDLPELPLASDWEDPWAA